MTIPSNYLSTTWTDGELVSSVKWYTRVLSPLNSLFAWANATATSVNFLLNPPLFQGTQGAAQSIPTGSATMVTFDTNIIDTYSGHSTVTNNTRYTAQVAGTYRLDAKCPLAASAAGRRIGALYKNGTQISISYMEEANVVATGGQSDIVLPSVLVVLAVGDYVEFNVTQTSGAALNTPVGQAMFQAQWVHA